MKNPRNIYVPNTVKEGKAELVKFSGFIVHVDTSDQRKVRLCFKSETSDKDSRLVGVDAWLSEDGTDWHKVLDNSKGRFAFAIARKTITVKGDKEFVNYSLDSVDLAPPYKTDN